MGFGFDSGFGGFGIGFGLFGLIFVLMSFLVLGVFAFVFIKEISQWSKNNHSPRLSVPVTVVAKRTNVSHTHHGDHMHHHTSSSYYVTFQVESGDRMELQVAGQQFGLMIEGDKGILTFQGTRFLDFQRQF